MNTLRTAMLLLVLLVPQDSLAAPTALKPLDQLVHEVTDFLMSDTGHGGIRMLPDDPLTPVPPYFYHYAIQHDDDLDSNTAGYPGFASISYPGYTVSIAVDAFLAYWAYTGNHESLDRAIQAADWLLTRRTPAIFLYGNWVYSTQTDGVMGGGFDEDSVMSDKPAMYALRCLRLYDITGTQAFLDAALETATTYRDTQMTGADFGRWPFRVRPSDGIVRQDYTSHLIPAIRLLEAIEVRFPGQGFDSAAANAWSWIFANPLEPTSPNFMRWEGFYEDITGAQATGLMDHYGAENTILGLIDRNAPGDLDQAVAIFDWSTGRYLAPDNSQNGFGFYAPALLEWDAWLNTTYAATGQWAVTALRLDRATAGTARHDASWKPDALAALNTMTYGQGTEPLPADDRMLTTIRELTQPQFGTETWYEQNFNTVIYALEALDLAPELAPNELRLLGFDGAQLRSISRDDSEITATWSRAGVARFKAPLMPLGIRVGSNVYASPSASTPGWSWDPVLNVAEVRHDGSETQVSLTGITAASVLPAALVGKPYPNPFNPRVAVSLRLPTATNVLWTIVDARGRRVASGQTRLGAGSQQLRWDGIDEHGNAVASGTYRWRVRVGPSSFERTLTLVR